jgi:hypothetical protein
MKPALIMVDHWDVKFQPLGEIDGQPAVDFDLKIRPLGSVSMGYRMKDGLQVTVWQWESAADTRGQAESKTKAIAAMLASIGYVEVPSTAIITPLF